MGNESGGGGCMKVIGAFSSDAREQYKSDIYKVLSLPDEDVIHFRYKPKYVDRRLILIGNSLEGRETIIFFSRGNDCISPEMNKELTHTSVRRAKILSFKLSKTTDLYHVRLKLLNFVNVVIEKEDEGQDKFFKFIEVKEKQDGNDWMSRVNEVKGAFPGKSFFLIKGLYNSNGKKVTSKYNPESYSRVYRVYHGDRYVLKMHLGNPDNLNARVSLEYNQDDIVITHCNPFESTVQYDDVFIPLNVKLLPVFRHSTFLSFKVDNETNQKEDVENFDAFTVSQELSLQLNKGKAMVFGVLCVLAFFAVNLIGDKKMIDILPSINIILSALLVLVSTSGLFYYFNKK